MKANELAKYMRDRALLIEGDESLNEKSLTNYAEVRVAKEQKLQKLEELKKLYFNAGRWVGGARDFLARQAYEDMLSREKNANR
jgi:hypothetical protein